MFPHFCSYFYRFSFQVDAGIMMLQYWYHSPIRHYKMWESHSYHVPIWCGYIIPHTCRQNNNTFIIIIIIMQLKDNHHRNESIKKYADSSKMNRESNELDRPTIPHDMECIMHVNDVDVVAAVRKSIWEIMETMLKNPNDISPSSEVIINGITHAAKPIYRRPNSNSYILFSSRLF